MLRDDNVATLGPGYYFTGGTAYYLLPAPAGYWLPNGRCEVFREPCLETDETCLSYEAACSLLPDDLSGTGQPDRGDGTSCEVSSVNHCVNTTTTLIPCRVRSPTVSRPLASRIPARAPHRAHASLHAYPPQPRTFVQPCDWDSEPGLIGQDIFVFSRGGSETPEFPTACAAGLLGSANPLYQASVSCAGLCPAGRCADQQALRTSSLLSNSFGSPPLHLICVTTCRTQDVPDGWDRHSFTLRARQLLPSRQRRGSAMLRRHLHERHEPHERCGVYPVSGGQQLRDGEHCAGRVPARHIRGDRRVGEVRCMPRRLVSVGERRYRLRHLYGGILLPAWLLDGAPVRFRFIFQRHVARGTVGVQYHRAWLFQLERQHRADAVLTRHLRRHDWERCV